MTTPRYDHVHPCPECYQHVPCAMPDCTVEWAPEVEERRGGFAVCDDPECSRSASLIHTPQYASEFCCGIAAR